MKKILLLLLVEAMLLSPTSIANPTLEDFFGSALLQDAILSPDGNSVLTTEEKNNQQSINLLNLRNQKKRIVFKPTELSSNESIIGKVQWLDNRYFSITYYEKRAGIENLIDSTFSQQLLIIDTTLEKGEEAQILRVKTPGSLVDPLPQTNGQFLYAKSSVISRVYRLNVNQLSPNKATVLKTDLIDGGQFIQSNEIASIEGFATKWFFKEGRAASVLYFSAPRVISLAEFVQDGKKNVVASWNINESKKGNSSSEANSKDTNYSKLLNLIPLALGKNESEYYCLDQFEEESKSLFLVNFKTKTFKLIYESENYKIVDLLLSLDRQLLGVNIIKNQRIVTEIMGQVDNAQMHSQSPNLSTVIGSSLDGNSKLIYEESYNQPGKFLVTSSSKKPIVIGEKYPQLSGKLNSLQIEGQENIANLNIPYLLNLPINNRKNPLIVMPHGGPFGVFDTPYFDTFTQFFVSNGFAVLRVNFRGSGGSTEEFKEAGKLEWGRKMLTDIHKVTESISKRQDIDPSHICLFGMSYGGYAASMLLISHPEIYRCAVSVAGVYDVNLLLQSANQSKQTRKWLSQYVGDSNSGYELAKEISPVFLTKTIQNPIFLIHGRKDEIVDIEQVSRMKFSLKMAKKPFSIKIIDNFGHNFENVDQATEVVQPSLEFIEKNI